MLRLFFSALSFLFLSVAAFSQPYDHIITGDYVRKHFALAKGEEVKFEEFKKKTYPTATVVWGVVITSYSIHYTKLYEIIEGIQGVAGIREVEAEFMRRLRSLASAHGALSYNFV